MKRFALIGPAEAGQWAHWPHSDNGVVSGNVTLLAMLGEPVDAQRQNYRQMIVKQHLLPLEANLAVMRDEGAHFAARGLVLLRSINGAFDAACRRYGWDAHAATQQYEMFRRFDHSWYVPSRPAGGRPPCLSHSAYPLSLTDACTGEPMCSSSAPWATMCCSSITRCSSQTPPLSCNAWRRTGDCSYT